MSSVLSPKELAGWIMLFFKMDEKEYLLYRNNARTGWEEFYNADKKIIVYIFELSE